MADNDRIHLIAGPAGAEVAPASAAVRPTGGAPRRASMSLQEGDVAVEAAAGLHHALKRTLTATDLTMIGVSGIIGAGIFVLTGLAAAQYAGPAVCISFLISAVGCGLACLCYSELAAILPVAGSAYSFTSATLGPTLGWAVGWDLALEYAAGASTVAVGWSGYAVSILRDMGLDLPRAITTAPAHWDHKSEAWVSTGGVVNLPAILIIAALTALNYIGVQESARVTRAIVGLKIIVLIVFIIAGSTYINTDNYSPFVPPAGDKFGEYGIGGIL